MKTLYLIRHAKSSWKYTHLDDIDRPLNKRGKRDAPEMGTRLKLRGIFPDLMISSPANRALTTCKTIADIVEYPSSKVQTYNDIYHGSVSTLLKVVKQLQKPFDIVFMFGHNPGFTDFANELTHSDLWNIPTSGVFGCQFEISDWCEVTLGSGKRIFYDFPKNMVG